jgi:hypothetical protein
MPLAQQQENEIFDPASNFFSWQKIIDQNKDTANQQGQAYNQNLQDKATQALGQTQQAGQEATDITTKAKGQQDALKEYQSPDFYKFDKSKQDAVKASLKEGAQIGVKYDPNSANAAIANAAKVSKDMEAAKSIAGRIGKEGVVTNQDLFNQVGLAQGGAGQNADPLIAQLGGTSDILGQQMKQAGEMASGSQKAIVDPLTDYVNKNSSKAEQDAINLGKQRLGERSLTEAGDMGLIGNRQKNENSPMYADQSKLGVDNELLKKYGFDPETFIQKQNPTEADYKAYGAVNNEAVSKLNDTYSMLGLAPKDFGAMRNLSPTYDIEGAQRAEAMANQKQLIGDQQAKNMSNILKEAAMKANPHYDEIQEYNNWKNNPQVGAEADIKRSAIRSAVANAGDNWRDLVAATGDQIMQAEIRKAHDDLKKGIK